MTSDKNEDGSVFTTLPAASGAFSKEHSLNGRKMASLHLPGIASLQEKTGAMTNVNSLPYLPSSRQGSSKRQTFYFPGCISGTRAHEHTSHGGQLRGESAALTAVP